MMAVRIKVGYSHGYQPGHGRQDQGRGTVKDINQAMAVRIKVGEQLRISSRPSRWGTVKAVYKAMAVRIKVGYSQGYHSGHGGQDHGRGTVRDII